MDRTSVARFFGEQPTSRVALEALQRVRDNGISRLMVGLEIAGDPLGSYNDGSMIEPFTVLEPSATRHEPIGSVTSACFSPRMERNIGLAMIGIGYTELGTNVVVETPGGPRAAVVVEKPFIDPEKRTPRS